MTKLKKQRIRYEGAQPLGVLPYVWAISISLMYTICREQVFVCSVLMCALSTAVYMLVYKMQKSTVGAAVVTTLMTLACFAAIAVVSWSFMDFVTAVEASGNSNDPQIRSFAHFLFSASSYFDWIYAVGTILMFSVIVGFICCYFSAVLPRMNHLLLPAFIPIILAARTTGGLPLPMMAVIFGAFIPAVCCSSVQSENADVAVFGEGEKKTRLAAAVSLGLVAVIVALAIPKSETTMMGHYLDTILQRGKGFYANADALGNFASASSVNTGDNEASDKVLFMVQTRVPENVDRWSFDVYNGADGWTYIPSQYNTGYADWELYAKERSYAELFRQLVKGAENGLLDEYSEVLLGLEKYGATSCEMYIRVVDASASAVIMHPVSVYSAELSGEGVDIYRTPKGEMFSAADISQAKYLLGFYADEPNAKHSAALQQVDFLQLLNDASERGVIDGVTANAFYQEYTHAQEYAKLTGLDGVSAEIYELAQEITAGCDSDYEKFCAIEQWFGANEFLYDMDFVPQSAETEYFVFESKRGICSDFATATTLLARAAGLTARYTEGFALSEDCRDELGVYNVTAAQAHAYTQVYVKGCGWLNLDATKYVEAAESVSAAQAALITLIVLLSVTAVTVLLVVFRKRLSLMLFTVTYRMRGRDSRVRAVYMRTRAIACELSGCEPAVTTCGETRGIIKNMLSLPEEAEAICDAADKLMYSGAAADADTEELYRCFKRICRRKKVLKR